MRHAMLMKAKEGVHFEKRTMTRPLYVDQSSYTTNSGELRMSLAVNLQNVVSIELERYRIVDSEYTIVTGLNDTFGFTYPAGGGTFNGVLTLAQRDYTITELLAALKTALDTASGSTFTVAEVTGTGTISITDATQTFSLDFSNSPLLGHMLGFSYSAALAAANPQVGPNRYDLVPFRNVVLSSPDMRRMYGNEGNIARLTIESDINEAYYRLEDDRKFLKPQNIGNLDIDLHFQLPVAHDGIRKLFRYNNRGMHFYFEFRVTTLTNGLNTDSLPVKSIPRSAAS